MTQSNTTPETAKTFKRRDLHQQVTDTIIQQLEAGTVPWQKPWVGNENRLLGLPNNYTTGKKYRGINILLLWSAAISHNYKSTEWATLKQWNEKKEYIRKDEKGSMIVYYDTMEKEKDGEIEKIPFIKASYVFNRSQLQSYNPDQENQFSDNRKSIVERIAIADEFMAKSGLNIEHDDGINACYMLHSDTIYMPEPASFIDTDTSTATQNYYATCFHELIHATGHPKRLNRKFGRKFGDRPYAEEELIAELGASFLCSELDICAAPKPNQAAYINHWLTVLKENKYFIVAAARDASKAADYLHERQYRITPL